MLNTTTGLGPDTSENRRDTCRKAGTCLLYTSDMNGHDAGLKGTLTDSATTATFKVAAGALLSLIHI